MSGEDEAALRDEIERLRTENDELRNHFRGPAQPQATEPEPALPVRVLLLPDPAKPAEAGRLGPKSVANLARTVISQLRERQPDADWRAEHDLERIPEDAECYQLGQVIRRLMTGSGPFPMTFRIERDDDGTPHVRRCLIEGDPDSDRFSAGYDRQMRIVDELLAEGQTAYAANAQHHAVWTLKATDVVLAQAKLALAHFQAGRSDWKTELEQPRPEYDPHYRITDEHPVGW